jgi:hypothetical protein
MGASTPKMYVSTQSIPTEKVEESSEKVWRNGISIPILNPSEIAASSDSTIASPMRCMYRLKLGASTQRSPREADLAILFDPERREGWSRSRDE